MHHVCLYFALDATMLNPSLFISLFHVCMSVCRLRNLVGYRNKKAAFSGWYCSSLARIKDSWGFSTCWKLLWRQLSSLCDPSLWFVPSFLLFFIHHTRTGSTPGSVPNSITIFQRWISLCIYFSCNNPLLLVVNKLRSAAKENKKILRGLILYQSKLVTKTDILIELADISQWDFKLSTKSAIKSNQKKNQKKKEKKKAAQNPVLQIDINFYIELKKIDWTRYENEKFTQILV